MEKSWLIEAGEGHMLVQLGVTVVSGVLIWALSIYFLHRRLGVVISYLAFSELAPEGKTVSFTILNRGHRSEEDIRLQLDPARKYTLLASTTSFASIDRNVFSLTRLSARDSVQIIILVEGGDFDDSKIIGIDSRHAKGRKCSKLEQMPPVPGASAIALLALALLMGLPVVGGLYLLKSDGDFRDFVLGPAFRSESRGIGTGVGTSGDDTAGGVIAQRQEALTAAGWRRVDEYVKSQLADYYAPAEFPITIGFVRRRGTLVFFSVSATNKTQGWLQISISLATPVDKPAGTRVVDYVGDWMLSPNESATREMTTYLPADAKSQMVRAQVFMQADESGAMYRIVHDSDLAKTKQ